MNKISLTSNNYTNCIILPNLFIDNYMPIANGSYVKVYLYLVRCLQNPTLEFSISFLADRLENTENDIIRAIAYWEKVGLIAVKRNLNDSITGITLINPENQMEEVAVTVEPSVDETTGSNDNEDEIPETTETLSTDGSPFVKPHYTDEQINTITSDEEVKWMMNIIEVYLEHPLRPVDVQLILYLYESLNFSRELIMYLYEYCISKHKKNASYIEAVALSWAKDGIDTVEKAEANSTLYNSNYNTVTKAFGLNRELGNVEQQYINKWVTNYKLTMDVISEACNRTILATNKPDFKYADKILENWSKKNVKTLKDVNRLDEEHKKNSARKATQQVANRSYTAPKNPNSFNDFPQREYSQEDYAQMEKKFLEIEYFGRKR